MGAGGKVDQIPGKDLNQWDSAAGRPRGHLARAHRCSELDHTDVRSTQSNVAKPGLQWLQAQSGDSETETESKGPSKDRSTVEVARRTQLWAFLPFEMLWQAAAPPPPGVCFLFWAGCVVFDTSANKLGAHSPQWDGFAILPGSSPVRSREFEVGTASARIRKQLLN